MRKDASKSNHFAQFVEKLTIFMEYGTYLTSYDFSFIMMQLNMQLL